MANVPQRIKTQLHNLPGVNAVGEGQSNGQPTAVVFVDQTTPTIVNNIPESVEGIPVEIKLARGGITLDLGVSNAISSAGSGSFRGRSLTLSQVNDGRRRPLVLGTSIASRPSSGTDPTGTLGWFMTDGSQPYMLSNNHVFSAAGLWDPPRPVIQPGADDGGSHPDDRVGEFVDLVPFNSQDHPEGGGGSSVDVAWATIDDGIGFEPRIIGVGEYSSDVIEVSQGDAIEASGRTSGHQESNVEATGAQADICLPTGQEVRFFDLIVTDRWSTGGDSGSPVVVNPDGSPARPVGIHFAGSEQQDISLEMRMQNILDATGLEILTTADDPGDEPPPGQASFTVSPPTVSVSGQTATAEYTIENTGDAEGTKDVTVIADVGGDGSDEKTRTNSHTVAAGQSTTGSVQFTFDFDQRRSVQFCTE